MKFSDVYKDILSKETWRKVNDIFSYGGEKKDFDSKNIFSKEYGLPVTIILIMGVIAISSIIMIAIDLFPLSVDVLLVITLIVMIILPKVFERLAK